MGWWKTPNGLIGDGPADILDSAWCKIEAEYRREIGRPPTQQDIADLVEFTSEGIFRVMCGKYAQPFTQDTMGDLGLPRAAKRGAKGCLKENSE